MVEGRIVYIGLQWQTFCRLLGFQFFVFLICLFFLEPASVATGGVSRGRVPLTKKTKPTLLKTWRGKKKLSAAIPMEPVFLPLSL